ncbi:MAG: glycosyltransferase family 4 protein [Candidatus Methanomethylicaceae archaeon]
MKKNAFNTIDIIVVAAPLPYTGGGGYRALLSIKEYQKRGINPFLILPWYFQLIDQERIKKDISFLSREMINIYGIATLPRVFSLNLPMKRRLIRFVMSQYPSLVKVTVNKKYAHEFQCVISMHENLDAITTSLKVGEMFSLKRIVLLQLPPFYENEERIKSINYINRLWIKLIKPNFLLKDLRMSLHEKVERKVVKNIKYLLNSFDKILAVSRSIPTEMGEDWIHKVYSLDPGVALSQDDIQMIDEISKKIHKKEKIVIFGGKPTPEKGIIEALVAWKNILKSVDQDYKLIVTGDIRSDLLTRLKWFCHKLNIENNVLFTGFISRKERLSFVAKAKMMLYPSHIDSFPYAVYEALHLNTPVVAYNIPALKVYYDGLEGVFLVKELDIKALIQKSIDTIKNKKIYVEKPFFTRSWNEIMDEEINIIKSCILD